MIPGGHKTHPRTWWANQSPRPRYQTPDERYAAAAEGKR